MRYKLSLYADSQSEKDMLETAMHDIGGLWPDVEEID